MNTLIAKRDEKLEEMLDYMDQLPDLGFKYYSVVLGDLFGIVTDDAGEGSGEDILARCMLETYLAIKDKTTFEYLNMGQMEYMGYIIGYNILDRLNILNYGTSIRGAWLDDNSENRALYDRLDRIMMDAVESWNENHDPEKKIRRLEREY